MITLSRTMFILILVPLVAVLLWILLIVGINAAAKKHIYEDAQSAPKAQAALILGAAILRSGNLSPVLRDRVDQAIELYEAGKVEKIIASGDNSTLEYNEVQPIREYLLEKGIPSEDIVLDYAGFDTYSSIYRARDVFLAQSLLIVSQSFHLPRAIFIAQKLGLEANGVSADRGHYKLTNYFREMLADIKAVANVLFGRRPKYLGKELPIAEGRETPLLNEKGGYSIPLW